MTQPLLLICRTTREFDDFRYAMLPITADMATELLSMRKYYDQIAVHDESLFGIEFFCGETLYGSEFASEEPPDEGWMACDGDPGSSECRVAASTRTICSDGVRWSACPRDDNGYFETPCILWKELEAIVAGENPFPVAEIELQDTASDGDKP